MTFALPNLTDKFIEGSATAGTQKSAGLPNITGSVGFGQVSVAYWDVMTGSTGGVFTPNESTTAAKLQYSSYQSRTSSTAVLFDASRSSSIYGKSSTVQPPALTMKPFIYTGKTTIYKWARTA